MFDLIYHNREDFVKEKNIIRLKPYKDGLQFYSSFDSGIAPTYSLSGESAVTTGNPTNQSFGVFSNYLDLDGSVTYYSNNFSYLRDKGTIQFRLKSAFNNAYGYQDFSMSLPGTIVAGNYSIKVSLAEEDLGHFTIAVLATDTQSDINNKVIAAINTPKIMATLAAGVLRIEAREQGKFVHIYEPTNGNSSLITLLGGVEDSKLLNAPATTTQFLRIENGIDDRNAIRLTHNTNGTLQLEMYNETVRIVNLIFDWDNAPYLWYAFCISFDQNNVRVYIDGALKAIAITEITRTFSDNYLKLFGTTASHHNIDELIVYDIKLFDSTNYTVESVALSKYSINKPYIDIEFGKGYIDKEVKELILKSSSNCRFVVKLGNTWYYYYSGGWVISDGSFDKTVDGSTLETKFTELHFVEENFLTIRAYFYSNGLEDCWLEEMEIVTSLSEDEQAQIFGSVSLASPIDLSTNRNIYIVTDVGAREVDLTTNAIDPAAVSEIEILSAINSAGVPGLASATVNELHQLVLKSSSVGSTSFVSVQEPTANSAVSLVWGNLQSDYGADSVGTIFDYEEIFRYVRSQLGAPQVPVELTDEQLNDALSSAVFEYNRWRNVSENILKMELTGDGTSGYEIPAAVGGTQNIIDIVVQPRTGLIFGNVGDDLMANIYTQFFFKSGRNIVETSADYYLTLSAQKDIDIIMGTRIHHYFYNNRLWIFPIPSRSMIIGIKYRATLTPEEIVYNQQIRDLTLAKAKIVLGGIRSTFGGRIPMGDSEITLNGESLKAEGKEEWNSTIEFIRRTQPVEFIIG